MKIKKGKKEYPVKAGDCILDNGACLQFVPKDNSILPWSDWERNTSIIISKKAFKEFIKDENVKLKIGKNYGHKYYFYSPQTQEGSN